MTDKATPRPWTFGLMPEDAQHRLDHESPRSGDRYFIKSATDKSASDVCEVHHTYENKYGHTSKANAELIVRAVNRDAHFDEVVAALEKAAMINPFGSVYNAQARDAARKALAAVKTDSGNETKGHS